MLKRAVALFAMAVIVACLVAIDVAFVGEAYLTSAPPDQMLARILGRPVRPEQLLRELLGRDATFEKLDVPGLREIHGLGDLLKLKSLEVYGLRIPSARSGNETAAPLLAARQISIRLDRFALFERRIEPIEVFIDGLDVDLVPGPDGEIELVQLVQKLTSKPAASATPGAPPPRVALRNATARFALEGILAPGQVQQVTDLELDFRPLSPELLAVQGAFDLGLLGRWTLRGDFQSELGVARIHLETRQLALNPRLAAILSTKILDNWNNYSPNGLVDLAVDVTLTRTETTDVNGRVVTTLAPTFIARLEMRGLEMTYKNFAYTVRVDSGMAELRHDGFRLVRLMAKSPTRSTRVIIDGEADGYERQDGLHLRISLDDVELDGLLRASLQPDDQQSWDLFAPRGRLRAYCDVDKKRGPNERAINHMRLTCEDVALTFKEFPYPLEHVQGDVEFLADEIVAKNLVGWHGNTEFRIYGKISELGKGSGFDMNIDATGVKLDSELRAAFQPAMREVWDLFQPAGLADVRWRTEKSGGAQRPVQHHIRARCRDISASYVEVPYRVQHVAGDIDYEPGQVHLRHLSGVAASGSASVELNGVVHLSETAPVLDLEVRGREVPIDAQLSGAVPTGLRELLEEIDARGQVDFLVDVKRGPAPPRAGALGLGGPPPRSPAGVRPQTVTTYSGDVRLVDCGFRMGGAFDDVYGNLVIQGGMSPAGNEAKGSIVFQRARAEGKRLTDARTHFNYEPGRLSLLDLTATLYGGLLTGDMVVGTVDKSFKADLDLGGMDLDAFVRDSASAGRDVTGRLNGQLHLTGTGMDKKAMKGHGAIRIQDGQLWDVPVFLTLLKGLSLSQRREFQTGTIDFTLANGVADLDPIDFRGEDIGVKGRGTMDLSGNMHLLLDASFPVALIPEIPIVGDLWGILRKGIYAVEMTGSFKEPQLSLKPLPFLGSDGGGKSREEKRKEREREEGPERTPDPPDRRGDRR